MAKLRRDAARNRAALTAAAAEIFSEHGADASLDLVARRAHLGRGTLYRHFADRGALLATLLLERVELLDTYLEDTDDAQSLEQLVVEICGLLEDVPGLMAVVRRFESAEEPLDHVIARTGSLLKLAIERGQEAGTVRPDITVEDVLAVIAMIDGARSLPDAHRVPDLAERATALALRSLRPAEAVNLPVPRRAFAFPA